MTTVGCTAPLSPPQSSLLAALQAPPYPSRVPDPLKVVLGASYGVLVARRREVYPQACVIQGSYPRRKWTPYQRSPSPKVDPYQRSPSPKVDPYQRSPSPKVDPHTSS